MSDQLDYVAFEWVTGELDDTIKQARQALEAYSTDRNDFSKLRFTLTHAHQVNGTLRMVQLDNLVRLTEEIEAVAQALVNQSTQDEDKALEALMAAFLQLPNLLDRVKKVRSDISEQALLPIINELRAGRGAASSSTRRPVDFEAAFSGRVSRADFDDLSSKLRKMFRVAVLNVARNTDIDKNLHYLAQIGQRVHKISQNTAQEYFWRMSLAMLESLEEGALALDNEVADLLLELDKQLIDISTGGPDMLREYAPETLESSIKTLLSTVKSDRELITQLQAEWLEEVKSPRELENLGPDGDTLRSVVAALLDELGSIKDYIDLYVRSSGSDQLDLQPSLPVFDRVISTMMVLGVGDALRTIRRQSEVVSNIVEGRIDASQETLMGIAESILSVEAVLKEGIAREDLEGAEQTTERDRQVAAAFASVVSEARRGIEHAKEAVIEFIAHQWDHDRLRPVPSILAEARGALLMLPLSRAADVLGCAEWYVCDHLLSGQRVPEWQMLDTLADALTSVDYYLERVSEDTPTESDMVLDVAVESVATLGFPVGDLGSWQRNPAFYLGDEATEDDELAISDFMVLDQEFDATDAENIERSVRSETATAQSNKEVAIPPNAAVPSAASPNMPASTAPSDEPKQRAEMETRPVSTTPQASAPVGNEVSEEVDQEILDIFSEEVEEVLEEMDRLLPNIEEKESLTDIRRGFHTLKGSGRMVGAGEAGELAWSIENMLNRVMEGSQELNPAHIQLVNESRGLMPALLQDFSNGTSHASEHATAISAIADAVSTGQSDIVSSEQVVEALRPDDEELDDSAFMAQEDRQFAESLIASAELVDEEASPISTEDADDFDTGSVEHELSEPEYNDGTSAQDPSFELSVSDPGVSDPGVSDPGVSDPGVSDPNDTTTEDTVDEMSSIIGSEAQQDESPIEFDLGEIGLLDDEFAVTQAQPDTLEPSATENEAEAEGLSAEFLNETNEGASEPESVQQQPDKHEPASADAEFAVEFESSSDEEDDAALLKIFSGEAASHLDQIDAFCSDFRRIKSDRLSESLHRSLHTLNGSASIAGFDAIARYVAPMEGLVLDCHQSGKRANEDLVHLLEDLSFQIRGDLKTLPLMSEHSESSADLLRNRMQKLRAELFPLETVAESLETEDETPSAEAASHFMTEAIEVQSLGTALLEQARAGRSASDALLRLASAQRDLGELAAPLGHQGLAQLSEQSANVYEQAAILDWLPEGMFAVFDAAHEGLLAALDCIACGQSDVEAPQLIEAQRVLADFRIADYEAELDRREQAVDEAERQADERIESPGRKTDLLISSWMKKQYVEPSTPEEMAQDFFQADQGGLPDAEKPTEEKSPLSANVSAKSLFLSASGLLPASKPSVDTAAANEIQSDQSAPEESTEQATRDENASPSESDQLEETKALELQDDALDEAISDASAEAADRCVPIEPEEDELTASESALLDTEFTSGALEPNLTLPAFDDELEISSPADVEDDETSNTAGNTPYVVEDVSAFDTQYAETSDDDIETRDSADANEAGHHSDEELQEEPLLATDEDEFGVSSLLDPDFDEDRADPAGNDDNVVDLAEPISQPDDESVAVSEMIGETVSDTLSETLSESVAEEDAVDDEILEIFIEEAVDLHEDIDETVHTWQEEPGNPEHLDAIQRALHTLKGGARLADITALGDLAHDCESFVEETEQNGANWNSTFFVRLQRFVDAINQGVDVLRDPNTARNHNLMEQTIVKAMAGDSEVAAVDTEAANSEHDSGADEAANSEAANEAQKAQDFSSVLEGILESKATDESVPDNVLPFGSSAPAQSERPADVAEATDSSRKNAQEVVRVPSQLLENLVNLAGETSISRARAEEQVSEFGFSLDEMEGTVERLQDKLRRLDMETEAQILFRQEQVEQEGLESFDPLEMDRYSQLQTLSRSLMESASDLFDLKNTLTDKARDMETLLLQQARINTDLQEGLMRSRMVPFSRLVPRLRRIVRQVSNELGKQVEFELSNIEGEMDRSVLERMLPPLEHMLRNAVDHGIESADVRREYDKAAIGTVNLGLMREGNEVVIVLEDDGGGIDVSRVRDKAIAAGLMNADADLTEQEILQFILETGVSTAAEVTQISGRGVGLDVVNSEVKQLGGSMEISTRRGLGTRFVVRLPFTVSVNRALTVSVGTDMYAIPLNSIEGIVRISPFELEAYYQPDSPRFEYAGQPYDLRYLGTLLGLEASPNIQSLGAPLPVVLVRAGEHAVAIQVDGVHGSREVVVKSLGPQFGMVHGVSGATVLGDGRVVVILDLLSIIRQDASHLGRESMFLDDLSAEQEGSGNVTVMVVDDSVTVRKVTSRFLERQGMEVLVARDGVEAMALLQDNKPDVMLLDIEMPRMDGFEVANQVRHDSRLKDLPIIMITSRTGDKHRERAYSIGVNNYLGKPYQEIELMAAIEELVGSDRLQKIG